jgi:hypothetical protein
MSNLFASKSKACIEATDIAIIERRRHSRCLSLRAGLFRARYLVKICRKIRAGFHF